MLSLRRIVGVVSGLAVLACLVACGGITSKMQQAAKRTQTSNDLKQLGLTYHNFCDAHQGKGPANMNEWLQWAQKGDPGTTGLIQQTGPGGKYVILWGAGIPKDFPQGAFQTVLGYESAVPQQGGVVLMGDASVKQMTATEFAAAPKPATAKK
jgi:hypothetical protein